MLDRDAAIERLLDRYEQPTRRGALPAPPAHTATASNPRCGDVVTMFAEVAGGRVTRVRFEGAGCTVSQAAADVAAELAEGQLLSSIQGLELGAVLDQLGRDLVRTRLDCVGLGLSTLQRALAGGT